MINRPYIKTLRLSKDEYIDLKKRAYKSGLSESDIIRLALKGQDIKEKPSKELYELLYKINNIGNNINQIAKHANQTNEIYYNDLKLYYNQVNQFINDIRKKYL